MAHETLSTPLIQRYQDTGNKNLDLMETTVRLNTHLGANKEDSLEELQRGFANEVQPVLRDLAKALNKKVDGLRLNQRVAEDMNRPSELQEKYANIQAHTQAATQVFDDLLTNLDKLIQVRKKIQEDKIQRVEFPKAGEIERKRFLQFMDKVIVRLGKESSKIAKDLSPELMDTYVAKADNAEVLATIPAFKVHESNKALATEKQAEAQKAQASHQALRNIEFQTQRTTAFADALVIDESYLNEAKQGIDDGQKFAFSLAAQEAIDSALFAARRNFAAMNDNLREDSKQYPSLTKRDNTAQALGQIVNEDRIKLNDTKATDAQTLLLGLTGSLNNLILMEKASKKRPQLSSEDFARLGELQGEVLQKKRDFKANFNVKYGDERTHLDIREQDDDAKAKIKAIKEAAESIKSTEGALHDLERNLASDHKGRIESAQILKRDVSKILSQTFKEMNTFARKGFIADLKVLYGKNARAIVAELEKAHKAMQPKKRNFAQVLLRRPMPSMEEQKKTSPYGMTS